MSQRRTDSEVPPTWSTRARWLALATHTSAWSNPPFRQAWQLAADSNVDWGQGSYRLREWAAAQDESEWISYFGFGPSFTLDEIPNAVSAHRHDV